MKNERNNHLSRMVLRPVTEASVGDRLAFGRCTQYEHGSKNDPVFWHVVDTIGPYALLLCDFAMAVSPYLGRKTSAPYSGSAVAEWLDAKFGRRCFTAEERNAILLVALEEQWATSFFVLSEDELACYPLPEARLTCQPTQLVLSEIRKTHSIGQRNVKWWLRSTEDGIYHVMDPFGAVNVSAPGADDVCIRPAVWVDLSQGRACIEEQ